MNKFFAVLLLIVVAVLAAGPAPLWAQCTPTSAVLSVTSDDYSQAYVGGTLIGTFPYAGAPGTAGAANPTVMTVPVGLLTGPQVCLAVYTQNTAPQNIYSAWDLDITCSGGQHSEITSSSGGLSVDYVAAGNPSIPPANDVSSNPWYASAYSGGAFSSSYCSSGVTASTWASALYNPLTGKKLPFISNNCSGDYGTSNGGLFWRQCMAIPAPAAPLGPPSVALISFQASAVTNVGANVVTILNNIVVCNTGGPITNSPVTVSNNFLVNSSTCNPFQFSCWGFGDSVEPFTQCYYSSAAGNANEPSANGNNLIFPSLGNGCVTMTTQLIDYYYPAGCCLSMVNQASVSWQTGSASTGPLTFAPPCLPTMTPTPTPFGTIFPTTTGTLTPSNSPTWTPTQSHSTTPMFTSTIPITFTASPSVSPTLTPTPVNCGTAPAGAGWTQTTANAGFGTLTYQSSVAFNPATGTASGKMWVIGGLSTAGNPLNSVYNSTDGITWTNVPQTASFPARSGQTSVLFDPSNGTESKKMWVIGGAANSTPFFNDVYYSTDGSNWVQTTSNAGFAGRYGHTSVVYNGKMWVIGGYDGNPNMHNDVWSSPDGVTWTQVTANAAFPARAYHTSFVFNNRMWVVGGFGGSGSLSDVWSSTDGITWTQATASAAFGGRYNFLSLVFNNQMWVIGGVVGTSTVSNDVWNSTDGITWNLVTASAAFPVRAEMSGLTFDAGSGPSMWVIGGWDTSGVKKDVWVSCPITAGSPTATPSASVTTTTTPTATNTRTPTFSPTNSFTPIPPTATWVFQMTQTATFGFGTPTMTATPPLPTPGCFPATFMGMTNYQYGVSFMSNVAYYEPTAAGGSGTISSIGANMTSGGVSIVVALYTDAGGVPGSMLSSSATLVSGASGWNYYSLTSPVGVSGGTNYWLAIYHVGFPGAFVMGSTVVGPGYLSQSIAALPPTYTGPSSANPGSLALYADICLNGTPLPTSTRTPTFTSTIPSTFTASPSVSPTLTPTTAVNCATGPVGAGWTQTTANAGFGTLTYQSSVAFNPATGTASGKMWVIGGLSTAGNPLNSVYNSTDGITWTNVPQTASFPARSGQTSVLFDPSNGTESKKMWVIGGAANSTPFFNDVYYSTDGSNWVQTTSNAGFAGRYGHTSVVYNGKMWVIGGYDGNPNMHNDVWSSPDGVTWTQVTANAAFPARAYHTSFVFNNRMWVVGGLGANSTYLNDVWSSTDGVTWTQATASAAFSARYNFISTVFNNQMWVIGGVATPSTVSNDVWNSTDGITWNLVTASAAFPVRAEMSGLTFDAGSGPSMWVFGGWDFSGTKKDVWVSCPVTAGSPTATPSASVTITTTPTATHTRTPTITPTNSFTPIPPTLTWVFQMTQTATFGLGTPTITPTMTAPPTLGTNTVTFTPTVSNTSTMTRTFTGTNTSTGSPTTTPTSTHTRTPTFSPTNSFTPIPPTLTWVFQMTQTATFANTSAVSSTPTFTSTNPITFTASPTATATIFLTTTPVITSTNTSSPTFSSSATATFTSSPTLTRTPTSTASPSPTRTPTNTVTASPTATSTFTMTSTSSPTVTLSPTAPITLLATPTPQKTCNPVFFPNPSRGEPVHFYCGGGPYDEIHVQVYTTSFRKLRRYDHVCHGLEQEDVVFDLKDKVGADLCSGVYLVQIETITHGVSKKYIRKCLLLR